MTLRMSDPGLGADHPVRHRRRTGRRLADQIGAPQHGRGRPPAHAATWPVAWRIASARSISRGKSMRPLVLAGGVRAVDVAELALEALVDDLVLLGRRQPAGVLVVVPIDHLEQRRERRAELEAQPAAVAQVEDAGQLAADVGLVEVLRVLGVVGVVMRVRREHRTLPDAHGSDRAAERRAGRSSEQRPRDAVCRMRSMARPPARSIVPAMLRPAGGTRRSTCW